MLLRTWLSKCVGKWAHKRVLPLCQTKTNRNLVFKRLRQVTYLLVRYSSDATILDRHVPDKSSPAMTVRFDLKLHRAVGKIPAIVKPYQGVSIYKSRFPSIYLPIGI